MKRILRDLDPKNIIDRTEGISTRRKSSSLASQTTMAEAQTASPATKADIAAILKLLEDKEKKKRKRLIGNQRNYFSTANSI